jgi:putative flippase GtrA
MISERALHELLTIVRFALVGGGVLLVHLATAYTILHYYPDLPVLMVNTMAFVVAFQFSYLGHRFFTFKSDGSHAKFFFVAGIGLCVNNLVTSLAQMAFGIPFVAIALGNVSAPVAVFVLSRFWVFAPRSAGKEGA